MEDRPRCELSKDLGPGCDCGFYNPEVIHDNNSSDFTLSVDLDNMDYTNLSIDVESTELHTPLHTSTDDDVDFIDDGDDVAHDIENFDVRLMMKLTPFMFIRMSCVTLGHSGDARGDPPSHNQRIPSRCEGSGKRGPTTNKALRGAIEINNGKVLEIEFE
ncbi:hypothetical protein Tco_0514249 [Tanacetum coccineum]